MMRSQQDEERAALTPLGGLRELLERAQRLLLEGSTEAAAGCLAEAVGQLKSLAAVEAGAGRDNGGEPRRRLAEGLEECRALVRRAGALLEQEHRLRLEHWHPRTEAAGYAPGAACPAAQAGRAPRPHLVKVIG